MQIDITKQYETRDGRPVRIYATDAGGDYPIHGATKWKDRWSGCTWTLDGQFHTSTKVDCSDLVECKPRIKLERWANLIPSLDGSNHYGWAFFESKSDADRCRSAGVIACVKVSIDCCEGDGL